MVETDLIQTSAAASSQDIVISKAPRHFLVRLGIGIGQSLIDTHAAINDLLWTSPKHNDDDLPDGILIGFVGTIMTSLSVAAICIIMAIFLPYTFLSLIWWWPSIVCGLLPAEFVMLNVAINAVIAMPKALKTVGLGFINFGKFIINGIKDRIPDE